MEDINQYAETQPFREINVNVLGYTLYSNGKYGEEITVHSFRASSCSQLAELSINLKMLIFASCQNCI
jgi:hypothetical protein